MAGGWGAGEAVGGVRKEEENLGVGEVGGGGDLVAVKKRICLRELQKKRICLRLAFSRDVQ